MDSHEPPQMRTAERDCVVHNDPMAGFRKRSCSRIYTVIMDNVWRTILKKYPNLRLDDRFMSGCLYGLIRADLSKFGCISDELALQVRAIAMVCVQAVCKTDKGLWPPSSLHLAAYYDSVDLLEILLEVFDYGEAMTFDGSTPAQFAAMKGHLRALAVLYRNVDISIYCCIGGFNAYEFLKSFAKAEGSEKLPCLSRIYACGDNLTPSLGIVYGKHTTYPVPVQFSDEDISFGKEVTQVSFGKYHTIYLIDGRAFSCGLGRYGKLGHGDEQDQLKAREIKFPDSVVCASAGPTHSIICTRKKIIVFGLNNNGQLGLCTKRLVIIPTVVKSFKEEKPDYIISCSTSDTHSVVVMNNFDFYVTGTSNGFLWQKYSSNTFKHLKNNYAHRASSVLVTDSSIVRISSNDDASKITIKADDKSYYITSAVHITRCVGVYYTPKLGALFSGYKYFYENHRHGVASGLFLFDSKSPGSLRSLFFYNTLMKRNIFEVVSADVTRDGQIIIVDYMGDVYEGNLAHYTLFSDPHFDNTGDASSWVTDYMVKVKVNRLRGILPAKSAFLTPDGRNKVLNLLEVDPRSVLHCAEDVPKVKFPSLNPATVICISENGEELGRYETSLEVLKYESEVCLSYFERWAGDQKNEIRITAKPEMLKIFLSYCRERCLRPNLSMQELMELLVFADKLICKNFFNAVKRELFKPPFEMSNLRDLFALARHLSSVELYDSLSELCAAMFPTLLENGFVNELSLDEIGKIEDAFRSYALENIVRTVDQLESSIRKLVIPKQAVRNIIAAVLAVVKEPMDMNSLIDLCKNIKKDSHSKKRRKHTRPSGQGVTAAVDLGKVANCELHKELPRSKESDNHGVEMRISDSEVGITGDDVHGKNIKSEENMNTSSASDVIIDSIIFNESSAKVSKRERSIMKTYPLSSLSDVVVEKRNKDGKIKKEEKERPCMSSYNVRGSSGESQRRISNFWHLDEPMIDGSSFAQIMENEQIRQSETMRQTCSRLSDINMWDISYLFDSWEESAMAELATHYESEATIRGVSITVSTERKKEEVNDPLWAARS
uniref:BTB domain-containing protein n=1 Tax=Setaria digitata TaxID=48799 RepID=A0A915PVP0_9BILA